MLQKLVDIIKNEKKKKHHKKTRVWLRYGLRGRNQLQNFAEIFSKTVTCMELKFSQVINEKITQVLCLHGTKYLIT